LNKTLTMFRSLLQSNKTCNVGINVGQIVLYKSTNGVDVPIKEADF